MCEEMAVFFISFTFVPKSEIGPFENLRKYCGKVRVLAAEWNHERLIFLNPKGWRKGAMSRNSYRTLNTI